jgi:hypothetical protein
MPSHAPAHTGLAKKAQAEVAKDDLITELQDVRRGIVNKAAGLAPGVRDEVFLGIWSARDLVAHLVGWDYTNMAAIDDVLAGKLPGFYAYHDRDWRSYNAILVEKYRDSNYRDLLRHVRRSHKSLIERIRRTPANEIRADRGIRAHGWKVTIERLLQAELSDERTHFKQMEQFSARKRRPRAGTRRD